MTRRITESWISAYFDGELSEADRRAFERCAAEQPEVRACLADFAVLNASLGDLPNRELPPAVARKVWRAWKESYAVRAAAPMAVETLLDGELTPAQARLATRYHREMLESKRDGGSLAELPVESCPQTLVDVAVRRLAAEERQISACLREIPVEPAPQATLPTLLSAIASVRVDPMPNRTANAWRRRSFVAALTLILVAGGGTLAGYSMRWRSVSGGAEIAQIQPRATEETPPSPTLPKPTAPAVAAKAPSLDEPFVEDEWLPDPPKRPPPVLAKDSLHKFDRLLRPGERIEVEGSRLTFVCLDVQRVFDRLYVVLQKHNVATASGKAEDNSMIAVEIAATPNELTDVLTALRTHEREEERLIADIDVAPPKNARKADEVDYVLARIKFEDARFANVTANSGGAPNPKTDYKSQTPQASTGSHVSPPKDPTAEPPKLPLPDDQKRKFLIVFKPQAKSKSPKAD